MNSTTTITAEAIERIGARLAPTGLNRCQAVPVKGLPETVWLGRKRPDEPDAHEGHELTNATLLLVGHGGRALWDHLHRPDEPGQDARFDVDGTPDPIDTFSVAETSTALTDELPTVKRQLLYPVADCPVDLVALGLHIGWQSTSPLGLGISAEFGLWSAFRALWMLAAPLEPSEAPPPAAPDICATCVPVSCVSQCPADAVTVGRKFDLSSCVEHRSKPDSTCAETCLSRRACPVGLDHQYSDDQMAYHYRLSRPPVVG